MKPTYEVFCQELERVVKKVFAKLLSDSEAAEQAVLTRSSWYFGSDLETGEFTEGEVIHHTLGVKFPRVFTKRGLLKYAILSWFLPDQTRFELQEILLQRAKQRNFPEIASYCYSKKFCLKALFLEIDLSLTDLFGNLLREGSYINRPSCVQIPGEPNLSKRVKVPDSVKLILLLPKKKKRRTFRRGYDDHGSTTPDDKKGRKEFSHDIRSWTQQNLIELERSSFDLKVSNRLRFLEGVYLE